MASPSHQSKPEHREREGALRVILVGRTGLDAALRLDGGIELARVKTALDAVGELGEEPDGATANAVINVVVVGLDSGLDGRGPEFIDALRVVDPGVRVLCLEGVADGPLGEAYDGVLGTGTTADGLRSVALTGGRPRTTAARANGSAAASAPTDPDSVPGAPEDRPPPAPPSPPLPEVRSTPAAEHRAEEFGSKKHGPDQRGAAEMKENESADRLGGEDPGPMKAAGMDEVGDEILARMLLQGRDITDAAVEILRARLGGADVVFLSSGRNGREGAESKTAEGVSVSWRGRQFGRLRGEGLGLEALTPHAAWLGSWLALRDQHAQLREAAFTDSLTGAYNRRFFDHFLGAAIEQAREERRGLTVLMFDIDDFKVYNDRYGHSAGDEILVESVKLLRSVIRPSDKVCRIGGDEFVVVFHEPTGPRSASSRHPSDICGIAERFQREILQHKFPKLGREAPGTLTISGGLATYPWDGNTPETLLERADELAMQSKRQGKNCITLGPGAEREHGNGGAGIGEGKRDGAGDSGV